MSKPLDLEPIRRRYELASSGTYPAGYASHDIAVLLREVERLRANFDGLDMLYARHLEYCPEPGAGARGARDA